MTLLLVLACGEPEPEGTYEEDCSDGEDNDLDGELDCDDLGCSEVCGGGASELYINEFMASNIASVETPDGDFSDWLELYNPTSSAVDLGGWTLTDDLSAPTKHVMPDGVIVPAGGFLILWADDDEETEGPTHLNFHMAIEGESLGLYAPDGTPVDTLDYEPQASDISVARVPDGSDTWELTDQPTPGESNGG